MGTGLAETIGEKSKDLKFNLYNRRWKFFNEYTRSPDYYSG